MAVAFYITQLQAEPIHTVTSSPFFSVSEKNIVFLLTQDALVIGVESALADSKMPTYEHQTQINNSCIKFNVRPIYNQQNPLMRVEGQS